MCACICLCFYTHAKNIHWGHVCERWVCASVKIEESNRMYCRNMIYLVEGIRVTFSMSLLYKYTKFFIVLSYVKRLALISCAFYPNFFLYYAMFLKWHEKQQILSPASHFEHKNKRETELCLSFGVMGPEISWTFMLIGFFIFWVRKYCWSSFLGKVKKIIGLL